MKGRSSWTGRIFLKVLYENGTDAVLIGEMLMRSPDRKAALRGLRRELGHD